MASTGRQEQRGEKAFVPHASTRSPAQHKVNLAYKIHKSRLSLRPPESCRRVSLAGCAASHLECCPVALLSLP